jgi:hypothetical protein
VRSNACCSPGPELAHIVAAKFAKVTELLNLT